MGDTDYYYYLRATSKTNLDTVIVTDTVVVRQAPKEDCATKCHTTTTGDYYLGTDFNPKENCPESFSFDVNCVENHFEENGIAFVGNSSGQVSKWDQVTDKDSIADVVEDTGPVTISRKNQQRIITVELDTIDRPQGDVTAELEQRIKAEVMLPNGVHVEYGGMIEEQEDSEKAMIMMITLGVILVFMVMAAQFESLLHPLLIMFSVPFAFSGVVCALLLTGTPLSMTAYIGMILLVGIVVNNAIVLVDYINILRARGVPLRQAITDSGRQRLRPVLITTCTTLLGMLPMALSTGDGSATWRPLGIVVVGGLLLSTIVSMIIVPTLYYIVEGWRERRAAKKEA
jgi:HAE1 family hydrophobic/amphiphilic exporter-1